MDINGDSEGWSGRARVRIRDTLLVRCIGMIYLWLELGSGFNVSVRERWRCRVTVSCGGRHW